MSWGRHRKGSWEQRHLQALSRLVVRGLKLCQRAGLVKRGYVAPDGIQEAADASKHKDMCDSGMYKLESQTMELPTPAQKRTILHRTLNRLVPSDFNSLLVELSVPVHYIPGPTAPPGERTYELILWAEGPTGPGLERVEEVLNRFTPQPSTSWPRVLVSVAEGIITLIALIRLYTLFNTVPLRVIDFRGTCRSLEVQFTKLNGWMLPLTNTKFKQLALTDYTNLKYQKGQQPIDLIVQSHSTIMITSEKARTLWLWAEVGRKFKITQLYGGRLQVCGADGYLTASGTIKVNPGSNGLSQVQDETATRIAPYVTNISLHRTSPSRQFPLRIDFQARSGSLLDLTCADDNIKFDNKIDPANEVQVTSAEIEDFQESQMLMDKEKLDAYKNTSIKLHLDGKLKVSILELNKDGIKIRITGSCTTAQINSQDILGTRLQQMMSRKYEPDIYLDVLAVGWIFLVIGRLGTGIKGRTGATK